MGYLALFYRFIVRPLLKERLRTALTVLAVALGVAVVVAIELAGAAATGSFRSSLESLSGKADAEISAVGGLEETAAARLATLPYPIAIYPRITGHGIVDPENRTVPVVGWDLIAHAAELPDLYQSRSFTDVWRQGRPVWVGSHLNRKPGDRLRLTLNTRTEDYYVAGILPGSDFASMANDNLVVMDIATAQEAFGRFGRLDRIEVRLPQGASLEEWKPRLAEVLPAGVQIEPQGSRQESNRRLLQAFRWNLRVLSYISIVVGAFLIYNTISVSVVRRRSEIGILRAVGVTRGAILGAFLAEAGVFGLIGSLFGLLLGRVMAIGAVEMIGKTVEALYVSSAPDPIAFTPFALLMAFAVGVGVSLMAALAPAREAARVSPVEAMARGRREFGARLHAVRDLILGLVLAALGAAAAQAPPVNQMPLFGYLSALLFIAGSALTIPALVRAIASLSNRFVLGLTGVEGLLASRSLAASLWRTSVLVGALSTAVGMMTSVGIMVGSFRETVMVWMDERLLADLYLRPAGEPAPGEYPTMDAAIAARLAQVPGVAAVDRFKAYDIDYRGLPASIAGADTSIHAKYARTRFLPGEDRESILAQLPDRDAAIVSEPFANKYGVLTGDTLRLPLAGREVRLRVAGVYYDYSSERGMVLMDWSTLQKYIPDPDPSHVAVYLAPGAELGPVRAAVEQIASPAGVLTFRNRTLRDEAVRIFDRTFAITYALEAVAILVAVIGIAGALLALVIDRRRELSLLRFLGASASQIRRLILFEAGFLGLLANLSGLALGSVLSLVLIFVINKQSFGWTIQFHWPVALLGGALTLVFAATVLSGLQPARAALQLNPIEVIHEE